MSMPLQMQYYDHTLVVEGQHLDRLKHVNNIEYLRWTQEAAMAHSEMNGWPPERYDELGQGWVVRSHYIDYLIPAVLDDKILIRTCLGARKKVTCLRKYRIYRCGEYEYELLALAETLWAFIDYETARPVRIPDEILSSFTPLAKVPDPVIVIPPTWKKKWSSNIDAPPRDVHQEPEETDIEEEVEEEENVAPIVVESTETAVGAPEELPEEEFLDEPEPAEEPKEKQEESLEDMLRELGALDEDEPLTPPPAPTPPSAPPEAPTLQEEIAENERHEQGIAELEKEDSELNEVLLEEASAAAEKDAMSNDEST